MVFESKAMGRHIRTETEEDSVKNKKNKKNKKVKEFVTSNPQQISL